MEWEDVEKKHMQQLAEFEKMRVEAWDKVQENAKAMRRSFGDREENLPASVHERMEKDRTAWQEEWGSEGTKMKELQAVQQKERERLLAKEQFKQQIIQVLQRGQDKGGPERD